MLSVVLCLFVWISNRKVCLDCPQCPGSFFQAQPLHTVAMSNQSKFQKDLTISEEDNDPERAKTVKRARKSYDDNRKYLESWEKEFTWLTSVTSQGVKLPFCKLCRKSLQPHCGTLAKHAQGAQHKEVFKSASVSKTLNFLKKKPGLSDDLKRIELELALATCCHCPTLAIDHLGEVIKKNGKGSTLEHLRLHRTKCTALINSVLSPSLMFSPMLDETTDVTVEKLLAIRTRYFSEKSGEVVTPFLGLYPVVHATGEALFQIVRGCLFEYGMCLSDCVGIACDGAAVMVGEHNSVWSRIK